MEYTLRQRMSLVLEADTTAESIVSLRDAEIDHAFLLAHRISPTLLRAAKITPLQLKAHGTNSVSKLTELGFSALHLLDEVWCGQCVAAYGAPSLLDEFLVTTNDAVVLAASPAIATSDVARRSCTVSGTATGTSAACSRAATCSTPAVLAPRS